MADTVVKYRVDSGLGGMFWAMGWLFTLGWLHLQIPKALYAIVIWPYYIGDALSKKP